ncbi:MAG: hypothetical protein VKK59_03450 [Vampirovibrionales bacterium]|nr:hypothetical protein [Vampirovibrionales bacterium]
MSYKNDSEIVILNSYGKMSGNAKAELFETYDRLRDLTASGPTIGGSGLGKFAMTLMNLSKLVGGSSLMPTMGSEAITIPGTSYVAPLGGGTGIVPGGQASFGLAPFSQVAGITAGGAAPLNPNFELTQTLAQGIGSLPFDEGFDLQSGTIAGGAASIGSGALAPTAGGYAAAGIGATAGVAAGAGFGRNFVLPAAGIVSGIGGLLTTLAPFAGPYGLAGAAAGSILNGAAGAVINSFQQSANRILANADTILSNKVKNLETVTKMLDAQQDVLKKMVKENYEGAKKALETI